MTSWKDQLQEAYKVMRDKQKALKPDTSSKFDSEKNYKGRAGFNDVGLPITAKTIKQKSKNRSMYAARAHAKYWAAGSQLRNINEKRKADAIAKYGNKSVEHEPYKPSPAPVAPRRSSFDMGGIYHAGSNKGYGSPGYLGNTYNDTRSYEPTNRGRKINKKGPYEI
tara:strand:+ start:5939 stop:6436 length:498 start_codon:yes stop_codon:yes gene_type:complete